MTVWVVRTKTTGYIWGIWKDRGDIPIKFFPTAFVSDYFIDEIEVL